MHNAVSRIVGALALLLASASAVAAQGGIVFTDGIRLNVSAQTIADNGTGAAATGTITVLKSYVLLTCSDTNGCTMSVGETGARDGLFLTIVNTSSNTATFASSSGVLELDSTVALGQYDTLTLLYRTDRWVQLAPGAGGGGGGAPTSAQYVTLATDGTLSNERVLTAGTGISVTDAGAGSTVTVALSGGTLDLASEVTGTLPVANGGTNNTTADDDKVMVGNGTTWQQKAIADCDNATTSKLLYDTSTNAFSCGTDQTGGAGGSKSIGITIDGGGSTITTGVKGFVVAPANCTISSATLLSTDASVTSGSIVVDVWKDTYASYPPTVADTITASAKPTLSSATKSQDSTLTGWTTSVTAGDILGFKVDSVTTLTRASLFLRCD
jgi:hypothetical protein